MLRRELIVLRPDAAAHFSSDETALYEQMLLEASQGMVRAAGRLDDFATSLAQTQLRHQTAMLDRQEEMLSMLQTLGPSLATWLAGPTDAALRFEQEIYRPAVIRKLDKLEPFGIEEGDRYADTLKLTDTFVEPDLLLTVWTDEPTPGRRQDFDERRGDIPRKQERRLPVFQALSQVQRLMVEGAAGSGKSTFLQWLGLCAAKQSFPPSLESWNALVPFFIRLRDYQDQGFPPPEAWADKITTMGAGEMPNGWARAVLRRGEGLVLIDGVDEMKRADRDAMLEALQELTVMYPLSRFIVTSRPPAVDETSWPAWHAWLEEAGFIESALPEMTWPQIEDFVGRWHAALRSVTSRGDGRQKIDRNREGTVRLLQRESALRRLAATPLLCAMICALYQRQQDHIASDRLELYKNCVDMLLWERDRKHPRRKVPALEDYPQFNRPHSKTHLLRLLSSLAYWMMDEGRSAVSQERVVAQFRDYLPNLGLDASLSDIAFEYFNERASMWEEPVDGTVEFRHRTFQEYLAARWAMGHDKVGALAERSTNPQWRETIVLAVGSGATPTQSWQLLLELLQRADAAKDDPDTQRYLLLVALDCLETCSELPKPSYWQDVVDAARPAFPPHSREEVEMVANGGSYAVDLLAYDPDFPSEIAVYCIQALAAIGGEKALQAIAAYSINENWRVRRAIGDAWSQFEAQRYFDQVLANWRTCWFYRVFRLTMCGCNCWVISPSLTSVIRKSATSARWSASPISPSFSLVERKSATLARSPASPISPSFSLVERKSATSARSPASPISSSLISIEHTSATSARSPASPISPSLTSVERLSKISARSPASQVSPSLA